MKFLGSLTNRIFLASAALAVVSIVAAVYFVSRTTTREAEAELQRGLIEAGTLVEQQTAALVKTQTVMARLAVASFAETGWCSNFADRLISDAWSNSRKRSGSR